MRAGLDLRGFKQAEAVGIFQKSYYIYAPAELASGMAVASAFHGRLPGFAQTISACAVPASLFFTHGFGMDCDPA